MSKPRFCDACGEPLGDTSRFCAGCGKPVGVQVATAPIEPSPPAVITCPHCGTVKSAPRAGCAHCSHIDMKYVGQGHNQQETTPSPSPRLPVSPSHPVATPSPTPRIVYWLGGFAALLMAFALFKGVTAAPKQQPTPTALPVRAFATSRPAVATSAPTVAAAPTANPFVSITYAVTGSAGVNRASLTYRNEQGGTEQLDVTLPWSKTISVKPGEFLYIAAQNASRASGDIVCDITANGRPFKHSVSNGEYVIASCDGSAPRP